MWSDYQLAVFNAVKEGESSILVNAVAGSGKTTTLIESVGKVKNGSILILAFARKIAEELQQKITTPGVVITTLHANGLKTLSVNKKRLVKPYKLLDIAQEMELDNCSAYSKAVTYLKDFGYPFLGMSMRDIFLQQDFDLPEPPEKFEPSCEAILEKSNSLDGTVDFSDMGYLPLLKNMPLKKYDWIFVDEAQDLNKLQQETIRRMMHQNTKVVAFGDRNQAIYGFRGADKNSFDSLKEMTNARILPLSISYRCGKDIVSLAKTAVPHIEAFADSPDGEVHYIHKNDFNYGQLRINKDIAVVARYNNSLTEIAFNLAEKRIPFYFVNSKYSLGLKGLIKQSKVKNLDMLLKYLKDLAYANDLSESRNDMLNDKIQSIFNIANQPHVTSINGLIYEIDGIFNNKSGIPLYTIHGSKGLEFDTVIFYGSDLLLSKQATSEWQLEQEVNLFYVAVTRAKKHLTLVKVKKYD